MTTDSIRDILEKVKNGTMPTEAAMERLRDLPFEDLQYAKVDHHRGLRNGYPEVILGQGKTKEHIRGIIEAMLPHNCNILVTRVTSAVYEYLQEFIQDMVYEELPRIIVVRRQALQTTNGSILVVSAGTADLPVAEEAAVVAEVLGNDVQRLYDVGVAGIHRLLAHRQMMNQSNVLIVVAGMEGALASVVGGLVDKPVIAVPTSVGYGASFGGVSALLTMLNSCASGVGVVNIDNGFGAAYLASTINRQIDQAAKES